MFYSNGLFEKEVSDGIPIYSLDSRNYVKSIMDIVDDFRRDNYANMVIDSSKEDKETAMDCIPLAEQGIKDLKNYYDSGFLEDYGLAKSASIGLAPPVGILSYLSFSGALNSPLASLFFSALTAGALLATPRLVKRCARGNVRNYDTDLQYLPLLEEALCTPCGEL